MASKAKLRFKIAERDGPNRRTGAIATRNGRPAWEHAPPRKRGDMLDWLASRGLTVSGALAN